MKEGLTKIIFFYDFSVKEDNNKETKIIETTKYSETANAYMRELQIKKDDAFDFFDILNSFLR